MAEIYASLIKKGLMSLDDVPPELYEDVKRILDGE